MTETKKKAPIAALPKVAEAVIAAHIADSQMPSSMQGIYRRAMTGRSRQAAMKSFCLECQGYDRKAVAECVARNCSLWRFRPFQGTP